ncbi:MAG: PAS domain-containing protein [Eubacteriales bacterium]
MEMYQNIGNFINHYGNPFFVGSLLEKKVLFVNEKGKALFDCTEETCDFEKIFERTEERLESLIVKGLKSGKPTLFYNFIAITGQQEKIVVDLQFGFFNENNTEMFLEIIPRDDTRLAMALHQIQHSPRAEAILNLDEDLTILECNQAFHQLFQSNDDMWQAVFRKQLAQGFHAESRSQLVKEIHECLRSKDNYTKELKIETAQGEDHWYCLELQKRELDNSGTKLMCSLVNIEKQMEIKEENAILNQYLSIMQENSNDILYRVDIKENIMYHYSDYITVGGKGRAIPDYVNVFMSGTIIHPEDKSAYLASFKDFYEKDIPPSVPIRFSFDGDEYQWYHIAGKKIYNSKGELAEVFGALINVDKEVHMQEEVSHVHNYFEAFQTVSDESFCVINLEEKTLTQKGDVAKELGITEVLQNFPECAFELIHPEDLSNFQAFTEESVLGDTIRIQTRMKTVNGDYQWYELRSQGITDKTGKTTEIVGKINNIQKQKKCKNKFPL